MNEELKINTLPLATFNERVKPAFMDNIGPFMLFFVANLITTNIFSLGVASIILGAIVNFLGLFALLFISGYASSINFGITPNKLRYGVRVLKLVNKDTMEIRTITKSDMALMMGRAFIGWLETFFVLPVLIPYLMITNSKNKQTLTDMIFGQL
ncbi:MAG: RDD family protein [Candidatus Heimdallarchaeota archaeon]|nr:RDD family protein [Candidatus Heimdallarchaeota archaeon]